MIKIHDLDGSEIDKVNLRHHLNSETKDLIVAIRVSHEGAKTPRGSLIAYNFSDQQGNSATPNSPYQLSPYLGSFFYLAAAQGKTMEEQYAVEMFSVPTGASLVEITGHQWAKGITAKAQELYFIEIDAKGLQQQQVDTLPCWINDRLPSGAKLSTVKRSADRGPAEPGQLPTLNTWAIHKEVLEQPRDYNQNRKYFHNQGSKRADQLKVAIICDEFTYNSFSPEFHAVVLEPDTWREVLEREQPDLFLCESAWSGVDTKTRPWRGQIYRSVRFKQENRRELLSILAYCKEHAIPTAFWNKEDPTHYYDRINDFVDTAARFDYIFTTAEEMVDEYAKFHSPNRVAALPFAVQPRDFNPVTTSPRERSAVFAGAWYPEHRARVEQMRQGLDWILQSDLRLKIFDRNYDLVNSESRFPDEYRQFTNPPVSHKTTAKLYRDNLAALNINTVTTSNTMFARRAFEIAASGSLLIGNYSLGVERIYGGNTVFFDKGMTRLDELSPTDIASMTNNALAITLQSHTYRHRFEQILQTMQIAHTPARANPTMMTVIDTHDQAQRTISRFRRLHHEYSRLLLVVSQSVESSRIGEYYARYNSQLVDVVSAEIIAVEDVPTSNYMSTSDAVWLDDAEEISGRDLQTLLIHGEYTRHPIALANNDKPQFVARNLGPGMRISAIDVHDAILRSNFPRTVLEVNS